MLAWHCSHSLGCAILPVQSPGCWSKAVALWTGKDDLEHVYTVGSYVHYGAGGATPQPSPAGGVRRVLCDTSGGFPHNSVGFITYTQIVLTSYTR